MPSIALNLVGVLCFVALVVNLNPFTIYAKMMNLVVSCGIAVIDSLVLNSVVVWFE